MSAVDNILDTEDEHEAAAVQEDRGLAEAEAFAQAFLQNPLLADAAFRIPAQDERDAIERLIEGERTNDYGMRSEALRTIENARAFSTYLRVAVARIRREVYPESDTDY